MTDTDIESEEFGLAHIKRLGLVDPDTTLGKLQRGRGAGWLECLELPPEEANDLLWRCIVFDPRWDQQAERRAGYYASLAQLTDFDVGRLFRDQLPAERDWPDQRLVVEVLARLDRAGVQHAGSVLLDQLKPEDEMHENLLVEIQWASEATIERIPEALVQRRDDANLAGTVNRFYRDFQWKDWAEEHPRIASALREVEQRRLNEAQRSRPQPPEMSAPLAELLEHRWNWRNPPPSLVERLTTGLRPGEHDALIAACGERRNPSLPFTILGVMNDPSGLTAAATIVDEPPLCSLEQDASYYERHSAVYRYFRTLGPEHTLPLAREWIDTTEGRVGVACDILALHAEPEDVPAVRGSLETQWARREINWVCDLIKALTRHPQLGPFTELRDLFTDIEYAYARSRIAELMVASDPAFPSLFARECLWDCEEGAQDVGIGAVTAEDAAVTARIEEIFSQRDEEAAIQQRVRAQQGW